MQGIGREYWEALAGVELDPARRTGLLLVGMGGPDGDESVEPFLRNLFADPAMIPLPRLLAKPLASFIARRRSDAVRERYLELGLGGASPQLEWTRRQCVQLESRCAARGLSVCAAPAMRYWHPFAGEALATLCERGAEQFLVLPTYPQFAMPTTGSSFADMVAVLEREAPEAPLALLPEWNLLPGYLQALADHAAPALADWAAAGRDPARCALLYTAHSLPERVVRQGDPYERQTRASVEAAHTRLRERITEHAGWLDALPGGASPRLVFQSKVGPVRWLGPPLAETARELVRDGCERLLVQPVSFACEHIETLHELDLELAAELRELGLVEFRRGSALGLHTGWLDSLADHLSRACFGPASRVEVADAG